MADTRSHVPTPERSSDSAPGDRRIDTLRRRLRVWTLVAGVLACALVLVSSAFIWRRARQERGHDEAARLVALSAPTGRTLTACEVPGCSDEAASAARFQAFRAALAREHQTVGAWAPRHCERHSPYVCAHCGRREGSRPEICASCGNLIFDVHCENVPPRYTQNPANDARP